MQLVNQLPVPVINPIQEGVVFEKKCKRADRGDGKRFR